MRKLVQIWRYLSHLGVNQGQLPPLETKRIVLMNQVMMSSSIALVLIISFVGLNPDFHLGHILNYYAQWGLLGILVIGLLANAMGLFAQTKIVFILVGPAYVVLSSMAMGREINYHFYLVLTLILPFFIFSAKQKWYIVFGLTWNFLAFFFIHWWYENYQLETGFTPEQLKTNYYSAILFLAALVTVSIYYLFIANHRAEEGLAQEREKFEQLLQNVLPKDIVDELNKTGAVKPVHYDAVTVLFTDFAGFTQVAESMKPQELVNELDQCFSYFDTLMARHNLEKLKTIGDSYMCAGGIPVANHTHAIDCLMAALEIQAFMNQVKALRIEKGLPYWQLRIGIHTGPLVAGVIGEKKFAYDVWGDTVNTASRLESSGMVGRINISETTHNLVKAFIECEYRGKVQAKNKGEIEMYFANGIKADLLENPESRIPSQHFHKMYADLSR